MLSRTVDLPFLKEHILISLRNVSANLLNKLCDLHAYTNVEVLTEVITLPVVSKKRLNFLNRFLHH